MLKIDGKKMEVTMAQKNMSLSDLSKQAGLSRQTLYKVRMGRNARVTTVGGIAKALGIDPTEIIKEH